MIEILIAIVLWLVAGWFAVRMRICIAQTDSLMFDEEVNSWTPIIFLGGPIGLFFFLIAPFGDFRRRAFFLDRIAIRLPKPPRPNPNLVKAWFGFYG